MGQLLSSSALHSTLTQAERLLSQHQPQDALDLLKPLLTQYYQHVPFLLLVGLALYRTGKSSQALLFLQQIIKLEPNHFEANKMLAELYHEANNNLEALTYINKSLKIKPKNQYIKEYKSMILSRLNRYEEAINIIEKVVSTGKPHRFTWNNLAHLYQHTGQSKQAKQCLEKSIELSEDDDTAYNNLIVLLHYLPNSTQEQLKELLSNWECKYAKHINTINNLSTELTSNKKLRIGMISDGFRAHPVGQMITSALEALPQHELELYTYSTNLFSDAITERIKEVANHWMTITHLNDKQLANQLVEDKIDILFDLCGHNNGSRMRTMAMKPAPILVKWVGGLINTTGLSTMDYLLSDHIETPSGVDDNYTEKLIRLPDDYICYNPPLYTPNTVPPPALHNNFITLGCFNNTAKLNPELLSHWARIMHDLPQSKLLLKSFQINSEILCNNIKTIMGKYGINEDRLLLEGPATHEELLKTYNKVDIALDPWPYSGGLTTCEALFMGVPVVTLPGPTFAGRHSATHLTNVGLGQLVAEDWQQYHDLVVNLASDLENLANIRQHLRTALLESPVCDAPRFARNFSNAMRAIWQRHCEGKKPAALSLDKDGNAQFADEEQPVVLQLPEEPQEQIDGDFSFNFTGRINALEHGATLASRSDFGQFLTQGAVNYICLDPGSAVNNSQQLQHTGLFEYFPLTVLGDGSPLTLALAVDATQSTTLPITAPDSIEFLSTTPVASHRLDDITGLDNLDWLVLDGQHDNLAILENGKQKLADALLIEVAVSLVPEYLEQLDLNKIENQLSKLGFELLTSPNKEHNNKINQAVFIPNANKLAQLNNNQLMKLAFILDAVYSQQNKAYRLLNKVDTNQAKLYLEQKNNTANEQKKTTTPNKQNDFQLPSAPAMTVAEQQLFLSYLKQAKHYFEFGSGGSTVWAVEQDLTVQGVESDPTWVQALQEKLGQQCQITVADIGPTGDWGYPLTQQTDKFPAYSQAILAHQQPFDLILIDGRFRVACTMAAIQHIAKHQTQDSTIIFIHDFWNRPQYHCVLEFLEVVEQIESAGVFRVKKDVSLDKVAEVWLEYSVKAE